MFTHWQMAMADEMRDTKTPKPSNPTTLKWGFVDFPPLVFANRDGVIEGELVNLMNEISQISGIDYKPLLFPNARAIFYLNNNKVNFSIGLKSLIDKPQNFLFSATPVATLRLAILWGDKSEPVTKIDDLFNKRLVLLRGYTYGGQRSKLESLASDIMRVETRVRATEALQLGRGDYAVAYMPTDLDENNNRWLEGINSLVIQEMDIYFILNKSTDNADYVMQQLESALLHARHLEQ